MRKTTRDEDLEIISQGRFEKDLSPERRKAREAALVEVYEKVKDEVLEKLRWQLIDALKRIFTAKDEIKKTEAWRKFNEIKAKIISYGKSESFRKKIASKIAKVSEKEAEIFYKRG